MYDFAIMSSVEIISHLTKRHMPGTKFTGSRLQAQLDMKREEIRTMVDELEGNALALCGDLCALRLGLTWHDRMQEKIEAEEHAAR